MLIAAAFAQPDPRGYGTHQQFGLPKCRFLERFGYPCPSCGATTAWAWTVRGDLGNAWQSHPPATALATVAGLLAALAATTAWRGRAFRLLHPQVLLACLGAISLSWLVHWFASYGKEIASRLPTWVGY